MLIVTAEFEQPQSDQELNRLLLELGVLALLCSPSPQRSF